MDRQEPAPGLIRAVDPCVADAPSRPAPRPRPWTGAVRSRALSPRPHASWWLPTLCGGLAIVIFINLAGVFGTEVLAPTLGWGEGGEDVGAAANGWSGRFVRWDAGYYLRIATAGYRSDGPERAFFPLYPLLVRATVAASGLPILWVGFGLSLLCFLGGGLLLQRLVGLDDDSVTARRAAAWYWCCPVAFFMIAFYPEALYLLLSIASIYAARKGNFPLSGGAIMLAGAARPSAFLLVIPYVLEFIVQRNFRPAHWRRLLCGMVLAPLGTGAYLTFLARTTGASPLTVYNDNLLLHWQTSTNGPWTTLRDGGAAAFLGEGIGTDWFSRAIVSFDLLVTVFGLALALYSCRHLRASYGAFFLVSMLFFTTSHGPGGYVFESMARHLASIVPLYPALAHLQGRLPQRFRRVPLIVSVVLLGLCAAWFASGRWLA